MKLRKKRLRTTGVDEGVERRSCVVGGGGGGGAPKQKIFAGSPQIMLH
jgi:hypothetical protein